MTPATAIRAGRAFLEVFDEQPPLKVDLTPNIIVCRFGLGESVTVSDRYPGCVKARMEDSNGIKYDVLYEVKGAKQRAWLGESKIAPRIEANECPL